MEMRKTILFASYLLSALCVWAQSGDEWQRLTPPACHQLLLNDKVKGCVIQPTMYGIFFEDINYAADGGLYAELVANRSFEFPNRLTCWEPFGQVSVSDSQPAFPRNPHYAVLEDVGHYEMRTGLVNHGYFGMGFKKDSTYIFSVYARLHDGKGKEARMDVNLVDSHKNIIGMATVSVNAREWTCYKVTIKAEATDAHGALNIILTSREGMDVDHVSLMPRDNWNGMRTDLVRALVDLHPGVFRFPGGCIVEGTNLATRYQWKHSVGDVENRPLNLNRWNNCFAHRLSPTYYQSLGIGFYEYFLLSEYIGADPLPILNCGMACQYQNKQYPSPDYVQVDSLQQYIQDALDLIEFANGDTTTTWGSLRAKMGHPAPFGLKQMGIGNEQWSEPYVERLEPFLKPIRDCYPYIRIVGSAGPAPDGDKFDYGWQEMKRLKADLVDEHYYKSPEWFLKSATRYDSYDRKGPKVFAGEYACHAKGKENTWESALCEAAFMTGLERNADVVWEATYAPLFAHVDGWQWRPDLIWFDNLNVMRTPNYYVQQLYATNRGTRTVSLTENGQPLTGQQGLYASAVYDSEQSRYIVKLVNTTDAIKTVSLDCKGIRRIAGYRQTVMTADLNAENSVGGSLVVCPEQLLVADEASQIHVAPYSFIIYSIFVNK
ncbi:MAG: alpha-L-arabinofuranosidase C-terminal domain-containing protein [Bacteroidaceae bacterium]